MGDVEKKITINFGLKDFKKQYTRIPCPNSSITWKEFITSNCKVTFEDGYIIQRQIVKNKKIESMTFFGHQQIADFFKTFKRNLKIHNVKVVKRPKNLKPSTAANEPRPSTSSGINTGNGNSNSSSPEVILIKRRAVSPKLCLNKRGPANAKAQVNNPSTGTGNENGQASASPRRQGTKRKLFDQEMKHPNPNGGVNGYYEEDNFPYPAPKVQVNLFPEDDGISILSQSSLEDATLDDIKALVIQRMVKNFNNTDFHRMLNEYRKLKSDGRILKLCRLLPWIGNTIQFLFEEPLKK